jgi:hypothetical protein
VARLRQILQPLLAHALERTSEGNHTLSAQWDRCSRPSQTWRSKAARIPYSHPLRATWCRSALAALPRTIFETGRSFNASMRTSNMEPFAATARVVVPACPAQRKTDLGPRQPRTRWAPAWSQRRYGPSLHDTSFAHRARAVPAHALAHGSSMVPKPRPPRAALRRIQFEEFELV